MSNETFALLTPVVVLLAVAGTGALTYWDIVRRHPVKSKKINLPTGPIDTPVGMDVETFKDDKLDRQSAIRLQENAASLAKILREANQLAASLEHFTKAVTGAK